LVGDTNVEGEEGPNEADLVQLDGSELLTIFRTGDKAGSFLHTSRSHDGGMTWSAPEPLPWGETGVSPQLARLSDGTVLLVYGLRLSEQRGVWARVSDDGGRSWQEPLQIY